ncbi:nucleotidyltransferase domain-containing protein [Rheinheimera riviphila]|uniref:Nucleotidyltransferase domain-containing protein n=1 Tax=Rheinheimera riviphila TaxID=1834037 RepID=A0A437R070_9GAMM|nr:nucleotidyltransferase domain-containing protein [Rheinheimera riviphila]RVU40121.1 nucleotidyltransferase domain-containing protein [Rheinheimera riviphila]
MNDVYGFTPAQLQMIRQVLAQFPAIEKAVLFGSRAKGTMNTRSDIDLAVTGNLLDRHQLAQIALAFDETDLPWQVDLKALHDIQSKALLEHIARIGQQIYPEKSEVETH